MANRLRAAWREKRVPLGTFVFSRASSNVEILGHAGFDFAFLDMEHAPLDLAEIESHIRAANVAGIAPLVRLPGPDHALVGRVLDLGAEGVVLPHFGRDREATRHFAASLRYEPEGNRPSCTGVRAAGYSLAPYAEHVQRANAEIVGIGLVEDASVVPVLDEVLAESRIDALMPGPADLSTSMGLPGQPTHPRVRESVAQIMTSARRAGLPVGMYINSTEEAADWPNVDFFVYLMDVKVLALAYAAAAREIRGAMRASR
jgi:2-keto-3-deoxy-L-rhamnonate aldolase RhmA